MIYQMKEVLKLSMDRAQLIQELESMIGKEKVISDPVDLMYYSYDSSFLAKLNNFYPEAVVTPKSTEEVAAVMQFAYAQNIRSHPRRRTGEPVGPWLPGGIVGPFLGIRLKILMWRYAVFVRRGYSRQIK